MRRALPTTTWQRDRRGEITVLLAVVGLITSLTALLFPHPALAQSDAPSVVWTDYDVTIDVREDGTMHVTERQLVEFDGYFGNGFANIPLARVEGIENVSVAVATDAQGNPEPLDYLAPRRYDENAGTFTYSEQAGELAIDYGFESTSLDDDVRLILLEYDVLGGIRVYEDLDPANQQVWWIAISEAVTDVAPVESASVTLNLPEAVPPDQTIAFPEDVQVNGSSYTWEASDLGEGEELNVRLQFPPITAASVPDWQVRDDQLRQERQEREERSAIAGTIMLVAGLLLLFAGGVAAYLLWFVRGRDPEVGLVAEYITEPPDDLRPGAAGTLLDETAHSRDVVATVLDLVQRKVIRLNSMDGAGHSTGVELERLQHSETLEPYEQTLLDVIFGPGAEAGTKVEVPDVAGAFAAENDHIHEGFYQELVDHKYFRESPERTRDRMRRIFRLVPLVSAAVVIAVIVVVGATTTWALFPILIGIVFFLAAGRLANAMPGKTMAGSESAAKWRAFKAYLQDISQRRDLKESRDILEKYVPYAVAFGLDESWVSRFAYAPPVATPDIFGGGGRMVVVGGDPWSGGMGRRRRRGGGWTTYPIGGYGGYGGPGGSGGGQGRPGGPGSSGGGFDMPDLQDASDSAGRGLQGGSNDFLGMLGTVAKAFAASSGSGSFGSSGRGGGFSGGGGFGGGG
ncbi:MAG: DUF2207 domain-containing protein, partial [Chloroflexota bacterium]|nr:DUF2207 domain-containing protein [Chloroflexota bacterium]